MPLIPTDLFRLKCLIKCFNPFISFQPPNDTERKMMQDTQKPVAPLTLVTAYYQVEDPLRPDRTLRDNKDKMSKLLPFIKWPVAVFCEAELVGTINSLRGDKPTMIYVTPREDFLVWRHREILQAHNAQRQPGFAVDLSLIYHEKANFVRRAIIDNPYQSEMFLWCDMGLMRGSKDRWTTNVLRLSERIEWPNLQACRAFGDQVAFFGSPNLPPPPRKPSNFGFWRQFGAARRRRHGDFVTPIMIFWKVILAGILMQSAAASPFPRAKGFAMKRR